MFQKIAAVLVALSQILTSFSLSVVNTKVKAIDYGGTPYVAPVITEWLTLVNNGVSDYVIIKGANCSPSETTAAAELQKYIEQISSKTLEIKTDAIEAQTHEIIVGKTNREGVSSYTVDRAALGDEGFMVKVVGTKLVIAGGELRGTLYGVYNFLEQNLGCRWFTPQVTVIPSNTTVKIDATLNYTQKPVFEYRYTDWNCTLDETWRVKQKMNEGADYPEYGGSLFYANGCHSMSSLLPETYFAEYPEYFSYREDKAARTIDQRCLTNPDVLKIVTQSVKDALLASPRAKIVSITQNDNGGYCQCPNCKASDEKYGGPSGTNIWFVNQVAAALEDKFPNVQFDTFAYQYTRTPPKNIVPRDSVIVRLCSIECCFAHPLEECGIMRIRSENRLNTFPFIELDSKSARTAKTDPTFASDMKGWSAICKNLYAWDYTTNFMMYLNIFANLQVLSPNMQFFAKNNVKGVFEEGNAASKSGEFGELRAYILAKLLWNPNCDVDYLINDFLKGYYGENSAKYIKEYIDIITNKTLNTSQHLYIFQWQYEGLYFTAKERKQIDALWDTAEKNAGNATQLESIQRSRISFRVFKANLFMDEFSPLNLNRAKENEKLYNDIIGHGITYMTLGGPISTTPNFALTPADWMT
ncbi:MAG: DUF4838 domain-containing protein [Eubacteriales bacterium]